MGKKRSGHSAHCTYFPPILPVEATNCVSLTVHRQRVRLWLG
jgi:hypothetical protein